MTKVKSFKEETLYLCKTYYLVSYVKSYDHPPNYFAKGV
jgi:hypothetical protein